MSHVGLNMTSEESHEPAPGHKRSRGLIAVIIVVILALIVAGGWFVYKNFGDSGPDYPGPGTGAVMVEVPQGAAIPTIGDELETKDVVASSSAFVKVASRDSNATGIQAGYYRMKQQMSAQEALDYLTDPTNLISRLVVVKEGMRAGQIYEAASSATGIPVASFTAAAKNPTSLGVPSWGSKSVEGFLYPATYDFGPDATAKSILTRMVTEFNRVSKEINFEAKARAEGHKPYDMLIMASIIEAEGLPEYFSKISRVMYNRIDKNMPFQMDSTINYYHDTSEIDLTAEQLQQDHPYNTHTRQGFPPTPIGSPSKLALEATLAPAEGPWLYFLSIPGTTEMRFEDSYEQFLEDQKDLRAALENQKD